MKNFKKNENYHFWHSPIALIFLFCIIVLFGYKIIDLVKKERETSREKELILNKIDNLNKKEIILNENIAELGTEEGREEIIREKYPVVKEGEKMITIVNDSAYVNVKEEKVIRFGFWNWFKKTFKK